MPTITASTRVYDPRFVFDFSELENFSFTYEDELEQAVSDLGDLSDITPSEIGASRIVWSLNGASLTLTGAGIGPINDSSGEALLEAINDGVATGNLSSLTLAQGGTTLATLSWSNQGYALTSGNQRIQLMGTLPGGLSDISELLQALGSLASEELTSAKLSDIIDILENYSLTGLTVNDGADTVLSIARAGGVLTIEAGDYRLEIDADFADTTLDDITRNLPDLLDQGEISNAADVGFEQLNSLRLSDSIGVLLDVQGPVSSTASEDDFDGKIDGTSGEDQVELDLSDMDVAKLDVELKDGSDFVRVNVGIDGGRYVTLPTGQFVLAPELERVDTDITLAGGNGNDEMFYAIYDGYWDFGIPLDYTGIATRVDMSAGQVTTDQGGQQVVRVNYTDMYRLRIAVGGELEVQGSDQRDRVRLYQEPDYLDIDLGGGFDTLELQRLDITVGELLNDYVFDVGAGNSFKLQKSVNGTLVDVAEIAGVEELRLTDPDVPGGSEYFSVTELLAYSGSVGGVMEVTGTDGNDDLTYMTLYEYGDINEINVAYGAGDDYFSIGYTRDSAAYRGTVSVDGGDGFDTLRLEDDNRYSAGDFLTKVYVDFSQGEIQIQQEDAPSSGGTSVARTAANGAKTTDISFTGIENVTLYDIPRAFVTGDDNNNRVTMYSTGELTFEDAKTDDNDVLDMRSVRDDSRNVRGFTQSELLATFDIENGADGFVVFKDKSSGDVVVSLKNIETVRLIADRSSGDSQSVSVAALLAGIVATDGADSLDGTASDDVIAGLGGNDTLIGLAGDDTLRGDDGDDSIVGGDGDNRLIGGAGNDTLISIGDDDDLDGGAGNDLIDLTGATGGYGSWIKPGIGTDEIRGSSTLWAAGEGHDLSYAYTEGTGGIVLQIGNDGTGTAVSNTAGVLNDSFTYVHRVEGTDGADRLSSTATEEDGWQSWAGYEGNDTIEGGVGFDELMYHLEARKSDNPSGVTVNFATGTATDTFGDTDTFSGIEAVRGTHLADTLTGSAALNYIRYRGLAGADQINGTVAGYDVADYRRDAGYGGGDGILADLAAGTIRDGFGDIDTVSNIDEVRGTEFADDLRAGTTAVQFRGGDGDDTMTGGAGRDLFVLGGGSNSVNGGANIDAAVLDGDLADFTMTQANGQVTLSAGNDTTTLVDVETLYFDDQAVSLDALVSGAGNGGERVGDATTSTAQDLFAAGGDDTLLGGDGADTLRGGSGEDVINGGEGNDRLFDAFGDTTIEGGEGNDVGVAFEGDSVFTDNGATVPASNEINDFYCGGIGSDRFDAGAGNDILIGDVGSVYYFGNDTMDGGAGNDLLQGANGADVFIFETNDGNDTIARVDIYDIDFDDPITDVTLLGADFQSGIDKVQLDGFSTISTAGQALAAVTDVNGTAVFDAEGTSITFHGLTKANLSTDDFIFV